MTCILLHRSPELFVQKHCIPSLILFLVFVLVSLRGDWLVYSITVGFSPILYC